VDVITSRLPFVALKSSCGDSPLYKGIGGRLQKLTTLADFPIDIGGEWIHVDPSILNEIHDDPAVLATDFIDTVQYNISHTEYEDGEWYPSDWESEDFKFVNYTWCVVLLVIDRVMVCNVSLEFTNTLEIGQV
jgi:hypothetical protein